MNLKFKQWILAGIIRHSQWRQVAFCVCWQHRLCRWWPRRNFMLYLKLMSVKQCLRSVNRKQFPMQMIIRQNNKHSKWLQILVEEDFPPNSSGEHRLKFISKRIQEPNHQAERTLLSTATTNMYRGKILQLLPCKRANEEREVADGSKVFWRSGNAWSLQCFQYYLFHCSDRQQELHDLYNARQE